MAWEYFCGMMQSDTLLASYRFFKRPSLWPTNLFIVVMLVVEWLQRGKEHGLVLSFIKNAYLRWMVYLALLSIIYLFANQVTNFIYFQF